MEPTAEHLVESFNSYLAGYITTAECVDESKAEESDDFCQGYATGLQNSVKAFERFLKEPHYAQQLFTFLVLRSPV